MLVETDKPEFYCLYSCQMCLANQFLQTAAVRKIFLEDQGTLRLFNVIDPSPVSSCFNEGPYHAQTLLPGGFLFHTVYFYRGVNINIINLQFDILLDILKLFLLLLLLLFLCLFLLRVGLNMLVLYLFSWGYKILENLSHFGTSLTVLTNLCLITRHISCGIFVGSKHIDVGKVVIFVGVVSIKHDNILCLRNWDSPGILTTSDSH